MKSRGDLKVLFQRFLDKRRGALSRLITLADNGALPADFLEALPAQNSRSLRVGVTGPGGAGKSTLCAGLIQHLRSAGKSVAVLACDPSSPFSGGALLGDRVRMEIDPADDGVFVRSISSRGATGGLSDNAGRVVELLDRFGFDVVLVESVGAGQDQLAIRDVVDVLVLVVTPAAGDDVQWEKAGLLEAADVVVVNKADLAGADAAAAGLRSMLDLSVVGTEAPQVPILKVVASRNQGIDELWTAVETQSRVGRNPTRHVKGRVLLAALQRDLAVRFQRRLVSDPNLANLAADFALAAFPEAVAVERAKNLLENP